MKKALVILLLIFATTGCANRTAGVLMDKAKDELAIYIENADSKVKQAEDMRLELELKLLEQDIKNIITTGVQSGLVSPDRATTEIIKKVQSKIAERDARLQIWDQTDRNKKNIKILMDAVENYHRRGITTNDIEEALKKINTDNDLSLDDLKLKFEETK